MLERAFFVAVTVSVDDDPPDHNVGDPRPGLPDAKTLASAIAGSAMAEAILEATGACAVTARVIEPAPDGAPVAIKAEPVRGCDLKPGDLFSTAGPDYWDHFGDGRSVGERVYLRTNAPADDFPDADAMVYRITIVPKE